MQSESPGQQTLAKPITLRGRGYWSGTYVTIKLRPASVNSGITFVRTDLPTKPRIPALAEHRIEVPRRTVLSHAGARVDMVEHILAALAGLQICNCEIWVNAEEMPAFDGSSGELVAALQSAGLRPQHAVAAEFVVTETVRVGDERSWVEASPGKSGEFTVAYDLDYGDGNAIGQQSKALTLTPNAFATELAPARTFVLESEAAALRAANLGLHTSYHDLLVFGENGPIDNKLRFQDECVRHKMLDMVGDLALSGCRLVGHFHACRSGHRLNAELVRTLMTNERERRASA